jgi:Ca-activated chloride channel family protein
MFKQWLGLAALGLMLPGSALAQGWIEQPDQRGRPVPAASPVVRVGSSVRVRIDGRVARFEVEERFRNTGRGIAEGTYLYPLAGEAVFTDFSLFQGDQELKGEVMNADQARSIYEEIVRKVRDPALLSLAGNGLIRAQVFPIQPGETRTVILRYNQLLSRDGDVFRLRYALGTRGDGPVTITVTAAQASRFGVPYSPTHELEWRTEGGRLNVRSECEPRGEFELLLPIREGLLGTSVVTHAPGGNERYAMIVLSPPAVRAETVVPRDLTLVVDVSGSMSGGKLEQARTALTQALGALRRQDRFRLIAFSNTVTEFAPGYSEASPAALGRAREFVDQLEARGGTNIEGALERAFGVGASPGDRLGIVLFLTDGLPSVGQQSPERLAAEAAAHRKNLRVFPVGVGHDVNTYLLDRLATEGRGRVEYVAPEASVEHALGSVFRRLDAPALTDLRIVRSPVRLTEAVPADLPDIFHGEELVIFSRYSGSGSGELVIEGNAGGRLQRFSARVEFASHETTNGYIAPLWASRRIGELTRQVRLEGSSPELMKEIRELALRHGIITEYTSYLVLEQQEIVGRDSGGRLRRRDAMAPAPAAQSGANSVETSKQSADLAQARSLAAAREAVRDEALVLQEARASGVVTRQAGGRLFIQRGSVWTDAAHRDSLPVVEVAPYSTAWFELARALPELVPSFGAGEEVLIAGRRTSVKVSPTGLETWKAGQLQQLVRNFRGQ